MEELLAPVLSVLNEHYELGEKLKRFVELFGGYEIHRTGEFHFGQIQWYGTAGFAIYFRGLSDGVSPEPPKPISGAVTGKDGVSVIFRESNLPVASNFTHNGREYVVVFNQTYGHLLRRRTLFLALLREAVEKMARK